MSHGQAGEVSDRATAVAGHGDGQGADRVGLIDDHENAAVGLHGREDFAPCGFVLGQWFVVNSLAGVGQRAGMVVGFADVEADDDVGCCGRFHGGALLLRLVAGVLDIRCRHPRYDETSVWSVALLAVSGCPRCPVAIPPDYGNVHADKPYRAR